MVTLEFESVVATVAVSTSLRELTVAVFSDSALVCSVRAEFSTTSRSLNRGAA